VVYGVHTIFKIRAEYKQTTGALIVVTKIRHLQNQTTEEHVLTYNRRKVAFLKPGLTL